MDPRADGDEAELFAFLRQQHDQIIAAWERAMRKLPIARDLPRPALLNQVGLLLDYVIKVADDLLADREPPPCVELSQAHALERLDVGFDVGQLITELSLLRECILRCWHDKYDDGRGDGRAAPAERQARALNQAIDRILAAGIEQYSDAASARERALRVATERALARERAILDAATDGIVVMDHDGKISTFNPAAERMFGYRAADVIGKDLAFLIVPPRLRDQHRRGVARYLETGEGPILGRLVEYPAQRSDGTEFPAEIAVSVVEGEGPPSFTGHVRDASDRKRAERAEHFLFEAAKILGSSLDSETTLRALARLIVPELADACFFDVALSSAGLRRVAWAHRDVGKQAVLDDLLRSDSPPMFPKAAVGEVMRNATTKLVAKVDAAWRTGAAESPSDQKLLDAVPPVSIAVLPLSIREQRLGALTVCFSDSGRRYTKSDLRLLGELAYRCSSALENSRLYEEAKNAIRNRDEILAVVAHDLRNPLNSIFMAAELLQKMDSYEGSESLVRKSADITRRASARMRRLIGDLLDLASIQSGHLKIEPDRSEPASMVREVIDTFASSARDKNVALETKIEEPIQVVSCDRDRILQLLSNLVDNALKATPAGGTITVAAEGSGQDVVFAVSDTGSGIPADELARVFERWWRGAKAGYRGSGRGLAIAKAVVEAHGGRIWAESAIGAGSTFRFTIPRHPPQSMYRSRVRISSGERFDVFRAVRAEDGRSVVLKTARPDRREPRSEQLLRHEWETLRALDVPGIVRPLAIEASDDGSILVLEDAGPANLYDVLAGGAIETPRFLDIAIAMATTIAEVHRRGVIHRDVCPTNFVLGERLTLVDFETATVTPAFAQAPEPPSALEGTLAYIAPEQTGRMSRGVDHRADLYALGATFYEMLTGAPPFASRDPLELLHAHVARLPNPPAIINASVSTALSNIVVKLLSKMPEWRYQTADALALDLEEVRRQLRSKGTIEAFDLGRHDVPYGALLGGHLYGREEAGERLRRAVERVTTGSAEVVLVTGAAGIGKTALVHHARDLVGAGCWWLEGKGDVLQGNVPCAPILEAFRALLHEMARQPPESIEALRDRLRAAIAPNGRVLTDMLVELSPLVGEQPPVDDVGPAEAEKRFRRVFGAFVRALVGDGKPLVLFLDDLQWADPASIKLLAAIAVEPGLRRLLVIAAYRAEDIGTNHPLWEAESRIRAAGVPVDAIDLTPLARPTIVALLSEAFRVEPQEAAPLADAITKKTAGNPFFVRRFLGYLVQSGLLNYDPESGRWSWDLARIEGTEVAENVVELLSRSIGLLPASAQDVLKTAACVGNAFGLGLLAGVRGEPLDEVAKALRAPIQDSLIVPVVGGLVFPWTDGRPLELGIAHAPTYRFSHDRIQEATYCLLGDDERKGLHLRIGRWLLANVPEPAFEDAICPIADQLNRAADLLTPDERTKVADLNDRAGGIARSMSAYTSALAYFRAGLDLLPSDVSGALEHEIWFRLARNAAEAAALTGDHPMCEQIVERALSATDVRLEKAALLHVLAQSGAQRGVYHEAIRRGSEGLRYLGVELPSELPPGKVEEECARPREMTRSRSDEQIFALGSIGDDEERARLQLLVGLASATWFVDPTLYRIVCCRAMELTMLRGMAVDTPFAVASYAVVLAMDEDYDEAYRFGRLAVRLAERAGNPSQECRALTVLGGHVSPWRAPLRDSIPLLRRAYRLGLEAGDLEYAAYAVGNLLGLLWFGGAPLDTVLAETEAALVFYRRTGHLGGIPSLTPLTQAARCLRGLTAERARFDDSGFDAATFERETAGNGVALAVYYLLQLEVCCVLDEHERALAYGREGARWVPYLRDVVVLLPVDHAFYSALALAAQIEKAPAMEKDALLAELAVHEARLLTWTSRSPANFGHKRELVAAERGRVEGRFDGDLLPLYESAIARAAEEGYVHQAAIGHERCARFLRSCGDKEASEMHFRAAAAGFAKWGASAKLSLLAAESPAARTPAPTPHGTVLPALDLKIVKQAAEALSSELVLPRLLDQMMRISIRAASAERAALVLDEQGPELRATATADGDVVLERTPLSESAAVPKEILSHALASGELVVLKDAMRDVRFARDPYVARAGVRSVLAVPLRRHDRTVGILYFENNLATDAFTPDRVEVFGSLSAQMAIALENSLMFEQRCRAEETLRVLSDASAALSESLDYDQVSAKVAALLVPGIADWCLVDVLEGRELRPTAELHVDPSKLPLVEELHRSALPDLHSPQPQAQVFRSREPILIPDLTSTFIRAVSRDEKHLHLIEVLAPRSLMVLPLVDRGRNVGVITLARSDPARRFSEADLSLAQELGRRMAMAVDNARLHRDLGEAMRLKAERDRYLEMIFRQVPVVTWATDRALRVTYAAGNVPNAFGSDVTVLLGRTVYDLVGSHEPTVPVIAHHLAALAGGPQSFQHQGHGRWYEVSIEPLRDESQLVVGIVGSAFDVTERRAAEEQQARSEALLKEAQRVAHIGSFEWDIAPNVVTWTDELFRIYGVEPRDFEGTVEAFLSRVHPEDLDRTKNVLFEALRERKAFVYDHRIVRPRGVVRVLHTVADVITDAHGHPVRIVGSCWDVTDLAEATKARERWLSLLQATVEATADGILVVDRTGRVMLANQRLEELWNFPLQHAAPSDERTILAAMLPQVEDPEGFRAGTIELHDRPEIEKLDVVRLKDGRVFERYSRPQRVGEAIAGRVFSYRDISERERLLRRALFLADATRFLASLDMERALDAVARLVVPYIGDGCAIDLLGDGAPRRLLAISRDPKKPISPDVHPSVLAGHATLYTVNATSYLGVPLVVKGGLAGAMTLAAPPDRRYTQADLELVEELGRRAALAIENARLYQRAREALRARDEFLSLASHEIRGPITSLHLAVQMLRRGYVPRDAQPKTFDMIERESRRLAQFVDELLDLSRIRAGALRLDFEVVDLGDVLRSVAHTLGPELARSGSPLSITIEGGVRGEWDRLRLEQIALNLLGNAVKFGMGRPIAVRVSMHEGVAVLAVQDQGMGIEADMQARMFQPFERGVSVRHYGGPGLGLYIVKTIVEALGGRVMVESAPGAGSTFTVHLPVRMP